MDFQFKRTSGISLIIGSLLLIATMVLHPSGGSVDHILHISKVIVGSHSLAILCLPFIGFGFYGISVALQTPGRVATLAFIMAALGLVAAMIAGAINGLTLPLFLSHSTEAIQSQPEVIQSIVRYGAAINQPMDYVFIVSILLAMGIWSVLILRTAVFPKWAGYLGLLFLLLVLIGLVMRFNFIDLTGFRIFIFGLLGWIVSMGVLLMRR
jgi:hypothetical protein